MEEHSFFQLVACTPKDHKPHLFIGTFPQALYANIFAFVGLCLVVCGKVINDPVLAAIGLLISFSGGVFLITSIVTILRKLGIEAEIFRYYIYLLKQAQF